MKTGTLDEIKAMTPPADKAKTEDLLEGFWGDARVAHPAG